MERLDWVGEQFSYAADCANGVVCDSEGLAFRFPLSAGEHDVFLNRADDGFRVPITPSRHALEAISEELPSP